jgi:hypothetical protein
MNQQGWHTPRPRSASQGVFGRWLALASLMLAHVPLAWAGAGIMHTTVEPLQDNVTYSGTTLQTFFAYKVTVGSDATNTNTINNVRFTGTLSISTSEVATFSSADGIGCNATGMSVDCAIGQLRAGQSVSFAVFFKSPQRAGAADGVVSFSGTTFYAEGTGGPNSVPPNSTVNWTASSVTLGTLNPTHVKSAVQKSGGTLFTGDGAAAKSTDTWTTTVTVPASATYTTADVLEETIATPLAPNLADQSSSTLTIPGQFAQLVIKLRRDASTLLKGAKIASARVLYKDPSHPDARVVYPYEVLPCTDTTFGTLPQPGIPCIRTRTEYTKKNAPTADWVGDWEFEILANDNGRYTN